MPPQEDVEPGCCCFCFICCCCCDILTAAKFMGILHLVYLSIRVLVILLQPLYLEQWMASVYGASSIWTFSQDNCVHHKAAGIVLSIVTVIEITICLFFNILFIGVCFCLSGMKEPKAAIIAYKWMNIITFFLELVARVPIYFRLCGPLIIIPGLVFNLVAHFFWTCFHASVANALRKSDYLKKGVIPGSKIGPSRRNWDVDEIVVANNNRSKETVTYTFNPHETKQL